MTIIWLPDALESVVEICDFIDNINTEDSSLNWLSKFSHFISTYAKSNVQYSLCRYKPFGDRNLSCINYFGWVIVFRIEDQHFIIHHVIRGALLT